MEDLELWGHPFGRLFRKALSSVPGFESASDQL